MQRSTELKLFKIAHKAQTLTVTIENFLSFLNFFTSTDYQHIAEKTTHELMISDRDNIQNIQICPTW